MASLRFIFETLLITKSPVLHDPRVASEVMNLCEAFKCINATESPQYFRILYPYHVTRIMERSKFPILLAVAQICKAECNDTVRKFISTRSSEDPVVSELVGIHNAAMARVERPILESRIRWLTDIEDQHENQGTAPES